jgi:hypothetical protein
MSSFRERLTARHAQLRSYHAAEPQRTKVILGLWLLLFMLVGFLALAPKPWSSGVAAAVARGGDVDVRDYVVTWLWWAALANTTLLALALATSGRWLRLAPAPVCPALAPPARRPSRTWVALTLAAMVTGGVLAFPRLSQSLWMDEAFSVSRSVDGYWRKRDGGEVEFRPVGWIGTIWYYRMPNNHVPQTILSRLSLGAWQRVAGDEGRRLGETALRLPAFVAGLASIGSCAWLLWRAGFPSAGIVAAWLLALHPWHLRYTSEARGYSLLLFLLTAHLALLLGALHRGSWTRWLAYGVAQLLMVWTYPGIALELSIANLGALAALFHLHRGGPALRDQLMRWGVATFAGAMLWFQLVAPHFPQVVKYMEGELRYAGIAGRWLNHLGAGLYLGVPWKVPARLGDLYPQLVDPATGSVPVPLAAGACVALALVAAGLVRIWRTSSVHRILGLVLLLPGPLTWVVAWSLGVHLRHWYLLFMLPAWAALLAVGATWPLASRRWALRAVGGATIVALMIAFAFAGAPARNALRERSLQPRRESVAWTRPSLDPRAPSQKEVLTASFSVSPEFYDPHVEEVRNTKELRELMQRADREGTPLYVNVGGIAVARRLPPGLLELVSREDLFKEDAVFPGFVPMDTRHVYRYLGAP